MKTTQNQKKEITKLFHEMDSKSDFLNLLNYTKSLIYGDKMFLFTEKQLNFYINVSNIKDSNTYKSFEIKKKSGKIRTIHAPNKGLKEFQKCLNIILSLVYTPHTSAFGFVKGKSIVDNAKKHTNKNYVYNIDLKDFFPSIDASRVWARLKYPPFNLGTNKNREQIANMIKAICCTPMLVKREIDGEWIAKNTSVLPQGAVTSPILTNAICEKLDIQLTGLSKRFGLNYSRYADDITFSSMHNTYTSEKGNQEAIYKRESTFDIELRRIISSQNFHINEKKVRLQKRGYKQEVTGIIVNEKVNTSNYYIKELRQWIYFWESKGYDKAYELFLKKYIKNKGIATNSKPNMHLVIEGKLLYLKMVKGETNTTYLKLKSRFDKLLENKTVKKPSLLETLKNTSNKTPNGIDLSSFSLNEFNETVKKRKEKNKTIDVIIETIINDGLDNAMKLYKP